MSDDEREESTAREFTDAEKAAFRWSSALVRVSRSDLGKLGHQDSRRGKQRAVALLLGHANPRHEVEVRALRRLLNDLGIWNAANFAQDMTKDSNDPESGRGDEGLWSCHTYRLGRGLTGRWILTERGKALAADYAALIDRAAASVVDSVERTFKLTPKAARCAYCLDAITDDNKAQCRCGSVVHATCLDEFARGSLGCALQNTTARCNGAYKIIAKPEKIEADPIDLDDLETSKLGLDAKLVAALLALHITTTDELREEYFAGYSGEGVRLARALGAAGTAENLKAIGKALQDDANRQAAPLPKRDRLVISLNPTSTAAVPDTIGSLVRDEEY